jgi:hypothetical protein
MTLFASVTMGQVHSMIIAVYFSQVYSIEEENVLIVWTLTAYSSQISDIGSAPWSKIKFFINQTIDIAQILPKYGNENFLIYKPCTEYVVYLKQFCIFCRDIFQATVAKILSESHILVGTNAGYALKFNLYSKKSKKYRRNFGSTESNGD